MWYFWGNFKVISSMLQGTTHHDISKPMKWSVLLSEHNTFQVWSITPTHSHSIFFTVVKSPVTSLVWILISSNLCILLFALWGHVLCQQIQLQQLYTYMLQVSYPNCCLPYINQRAEPFGKKISKMNTKMIKPFDLQTFPVSLWLKAVDVIMLL